MAANSPPAGSGPGLKRVLTLPSLVLYGIILIQPTAPMPLFGAAAEKAQGHVVTVILIGMVAMLFTFDGMGRDNAIPSRFFAAINPRTRIPGNNIILVGVVTLIGAFALTYPLGAELLNFGALIAFMGVNASAFVHYFLRGERRSFWNFLPPVLGFVVCFYLWVNLGLLAKIAGLCWLTAGVLYGAWRTACFTKPLQFARIDNDDLPPV